MTVVIVREDLLARSADSLPTMLNLKTQAENGSLYNTPPVFGIYILRLVLKWLLGARRPARRSRRSTSARPTVLYAELDRTEFWKPHADKDSRSLMNVTFRLPTEDLEKLFVKESTAAGFDGLKGHRSVGGMRASIYNAFPEQGVDALVEFMREFERRHGDRATVRISLPDAGRGRRLRRRLRRRCGASPSAFPADGRRRAARCGRADPARARRVRVRRRTPPCGDVVGDRLVCRPARP